MNVVTIHQAKTHLSKLIQAVLRGEEVVIARGKIPVARLTPLSAPNQSRPIGDLKGRISIAEDFDEPLPDFKDYR
jgi:prevent-host-death family protein